VAKKNRSGRYTIAIVMLSTYKIIFMIITTEASRFVARIKSFSSGIDLLSVCYQRRTNENRLLIDTCYIIIEREFTTGSYYYHFASGFQRRVQFY